MLTKEEKGRNTSAIRSLIPIKGWHFYWKLRGYRLDIMVSSVFWVHVIAILSSVVVKLDGRELANAMVGTGVINPSLEFMADS
ncbi:MAG: hypothetical protein ACREBU_07230 [Nitrososphaera sp.]